MPRVVTPLNVKKIDAAHPRVNDYKLSDGKGLYLLVAKNGSKYWRFKYRFESKDITLSLGIYPDVSLRTARDLRQKYREQVAKNENPRAILQKNKKERELAAEKSKNTFEKVAREYLIRKTADLSEDYTAKLTHQLDIDVYPFFGSIPIEEVDIEDIIKVLERIQDRGAIETAHRMYTQINRIFRHAKAKRFCSYNPCEDIDKNEILEKNVVGAFATLTRPKDIKRLLREIEHYQGNFVTKMALKLSIHVALRPTNVRHAEWSEIDFEAKMWTIPKEKMKRDRDHLIPLTKATIAILRETQQVTGEGRYVFSASRSRVSPYSDGTLNKALASMGFPGDIQTAHGFRAMFSTVANERSKFREKVIEMQLSHSLGTKVSRVYNRAKYLKERRKLMKWWSKFLTKLLK